MDRTELLATKKLPAMTMADLVWGPRPPKRYRPPTRLIFVAALLGGMLGCHASVPPPAVETVGQLAAGPSVWHAPTHATTDFGHAEIVETGDDSASEIVTTTTRTADAGGDAAELPEVAPKSDGVTTGSVRQ